MIPATEIIISNYSIDSIIDYSNKFYSFYHFKTIFVMAVMSLALTTLFCRTWILVKGNWLCLWELWHYVVALTTECHNSHKHSQNSVTTQTYVIRFTDLFEMFRNDFENCYLNILNNKILDECHTLIAFAWKRVQYLLF